MSKAHSLMSGSHTTLVASEFCGLPDSAIYLLVEARGGRKRRANQILSSGFLQAPVSPPAAQTPSLAQRPEVLMAPAHSILSLEAVRAYRTHLAERIFSLATTRVMLVARKSITRLL